jgi:Aldolase/RraA
VSKSHPEQWTIHEVAERPEESLVTALREFATTQIADCGGPVGVVGPALRHLAGGAELCGSAVTVWTRPGDILYVLKATDLITAGDVLVVDGGGRLDAAVIGDIAAPPSSSRQKSASGCLAQQGMLDPDDRHCPRGLAATNHCLRVRERHPPDLGRLVGLRLPRELRALREVQIVQVVGVSDQRLARKHKLHVPGPPPGFLFHLARCRRRRILAVIDIAARQLPHPPVHDEPVAAYQQHPLACVVKHRGHRDPAHPEHVLREPCKTGNLHVRQADPDVRRFVN